ncbi:MAG: hypothetical protein ACLRQA_00510 [Anaerovoracaceae bacterium]|nr:hypothetical protein [Anaerovoracaceae bacterium]
MTPLKAFEKAVNGRAARKKTVVTDSLTACTGVLTCSDGCDSFDYKCRSGYVEVVKR